MVERQRRKLNWLVIGFLIVVVVSLGAAGYYAWKTMYPPLAAEPYKDSLAPYIVQAICAVTTLGFFFLHLRTSGLRKERLRLEVEKQRMEIEKMRAELEAARQA